MGQIAEGLETVRHRIDEAAGRAGRNPQEVTLIAVSKGFGADAVAEAHRLGQLDFGENRMQELVSKHRDCPHSVRWHFVGQVQSNKVKHLLPVAYCIHSLDRASLAEQISRRARRPIEVLVEVNAAGDPNKAGVAPEAVEELVGRVLELPNLDLVGLMTMARQSDDAQASREPFRRLARLREQLVHAFSCPRIRHLSMGMSQDYEVAVEEGATMVRVGEAIFGRRGPNRPNAKRQASARIKSRER